MREYGLMIERLNQHGTEYVHAHVVAREPEAFKDGDYPRGCGSDGESEFDKNVPKHMHEQMLDGLGMYGFASEYNDCEFIGYDVEYRNVYAIDLRKTQRMQRTLKRVLARIERDCAREPGDKFTALAKALKLTFVVERKTPRGVANPQWAWMSVEEGRNRYRQLIEAACEETRKKKGLVA